jgi:hypothetical protein
MVRLTKQPNGLLKECPTGFSWTNLFFGIFVPLFRGDLKWFLIQLVVDIFTGGLALLIFPFFYNKSHLKAKLEDGWVPASDPDRQYLVSNGYIAS